MHNASDSTQFVYGLKDPRNQRVRYIGKAVDPSRRFKDHIAIANLNRNKTRKNSWIKNLLSSGFLPEMIILDEVSTIEIDKAEIAYIEFFQSRWLTNGTAGGTGGAITDPDAKERIRQAHLGRTASKETRQLMSESHKKRYQDPIERAKTGAQSRVRGAKPPKLSGEENGFSKLSVAIVTDCRKRVRKGESYTDLSKEYGFSKEVLWLAVTGATWKSVEEPPVISQSRQKLTEKQINEIIDLLSRGHLTQNEIAIKYNVHQSNISRIKKQHSNSFKA